VSTSTTLQPESELLLAVVNATDAPGLASDHVAILRGLGYTQATATDGVVTSTTTAVYFADDLRVEAVRLAQQIGIDESDVRPRPSEPLTLNGVDADLAHRGGGSRAMSVAE